MRRWLMAVVVMTLLVSLSAASAVAQEGSGFPGTHEYEHVAKAQHVEGHIETLPETGGPSILMLVSGVLLAGSGLVALGVIRRDFSE